MRLSYRCDLRFIIAICGCIAATPASPAEFQISSSPDASGVELIIVDGELKFGDEKKFVNIALNVQNAIVAFQSPGGNLFAGIEIGKAIHLKGFSTLVPDQVQCASACALAWLGGRTRAACTHKTARTCWRKRYPLHPQKAVIEEAREHVREGPYVVFCVVGVLVQN